MMVLITPVTAQMETRAIQMVPKLPRSMVPYKMWGVVLAPSPGGIIVETEYTEGFHNKDGDQGDDQTQRDVSGGVLNSVWNWNNEFRANEQEKGQPAKGSDISEIGGKNHWLDNNFACAQFEKAKESHDDQRTDEGIGHHVLNFSEYIHTI